MSRADHETRRRSSSSFVGQRYRLTRQRATGYVRGGGDERATSHEKKMALEMLITLDGEQEDEEGARDGSKAPDSVARCVHYRLVCCCDALCSRRAAFHRATCSGSGPDEAMADRAGSGRNFPASTTRAFSRSRWNVRPGRGGSGSARN